MRERRRTRLARAAWAGGLLAVMLASAAECRAAAVEPAKGPTRRLRELHGAELKAARAARNRADRLRVEHEGSFGRADRMPAGEDPAFQNVAAAYRSVIDRYPDTEIAAYCALKLAGLHKYRGGYAAARAEAEKVAAAYGGTKYGRHAIMAVALSHLQCERGPSRAASAGFALRTSQAEHARQDGPGESAETVADCQAVVSAPPEKDVHSRHTSKGKASTNAPHKVSDLGIVQKWSMIKLPGTRLFLPGRKRQPGRSAPD